MFVTYGITHCEECGFPLGDNELGKCSSCQQKYEKQKEKEQLEKEIERRVRIELCKLTKQIKVLTIEDSNGKEYKINGYWENNIFHSID